MMFGERDGRLLESDWMVDVYRIETHRSRVRRSRKPWARATFYEFTEPSKDVIVAGGVVICHPTVAKVLSEQWTREAEAQAARWR